MKLARRTFLQLAAGAMVLPSASRTRAEDRAPVYPSRPIRFLVPEVANSASDKMARILAQHLAERWGQPVNVDNMFNTAALESGAKSAADGYTLIYAGPATVVVAPHLYKNLAYDPFVDFQPISSLCSMPYVLAVNPAVSAKNVQEFIALAKATPERFTMSSAGLGQGSHLAGAVFQSVTGLKTPIIHYEGGAPAVGAVIENKSQWIIVPAAAAMPGIKSGKLRALALTGSATSPAFPDLPTFASAGVQGFSLDAWAGVMVPRDTPTSVVTKLNATIGQVLSDPQVQSQFVALGAEAKSSSPSEFASFIRAEFNRMADVLRIAGVSPR